MASLKDIAEHVGVSIRTVSRALKDNGYVKDEVRDRVLEAAHELGYRPNRVARSLRTQQSFEVTVIMSSIDELHVAKIAGFEEVLRAAGYSVSVLMNLDRHVEADSPTMTELVDRRPAGAAILSIRNPAAMAGRLTEHSIPYVAISSRLDDAVDGIGIDRQQGVYEAIRYLHDQGHRQISYVASGDPESVGNSTRLEGYRRAMAELGLEPQLISTEGDDHFDQGRAAAHRMLDAGRLPDAVQAFSDVLAMGFIAGLRDRGKTLPDDIALIGFDDRASAALASPPMTTVAQPNREVGREAAKVLLAKIRGEPAPPGGWTRLLPTVLVRRETA